MMATVHHVTSSSGLRKFQANGFLLVSVYIYWLNKSVPNIQLVKQINLLNNTVWNIT